MIVFTQCLQFLDYVPQTFSLDSTNRCDITLERSIGPEHCHADDHGQSPEDLRIDIGLALCIKISPLRVDLVRSCLLVRRCNYEIALLALSLVYASEFRVARSDVAIPREGGEVQYRYPIAPAQQRWIVVPPNRFDLPPIDVDEANNLR